MLFLPNWRDTQKLEWQFKAAFITQWIKPSGCLGPCEARLWFPHGLLLAASSRLGHNSSWRWPLQAWKYILRPPFLVSPLPSFLAKLVWKMDQTFLVFECCLLSFSESTEGVLVATAYVTSLEERGKRENHRALCQILRTSCNLYHWIFFMPFPFPQPLVTTILVSFSMRSTFYFSFYPTYKWYHPILVFTFWLISLSIQLSRFTHVVTNGRASFFPVAE